MTITHGETDNNQKRPSFIGCPPAFRGPIRFSRRFILAESIVL
jgi:hypothetical protein